MYRSLLQLWQRFPRFQRNLGIFIVMLGGYCLLVRDLCKYLFRPSRDFFRLLLNQADQLGVKSLTLLNITLLFTGMVLVVQIAYTLAALGAKLVVGKVVSLAIVRELGPALGALVLAGRVGSGITAEIGTMQVTEQIDALRAMGISPAQKLFVPKVLAVTIMLPILVILADFVGIVGGLFIAVFELNLGFNFYVNSVYSTITTNDIFHGLGKAAIFGFFIGSIGCYSGLKAKGGADGVGRATTSTVVASSIVILISDFFLTKLFFLLP